MEHSSADNQLYFIFVHGFQGWGSYDCKYTKTPYWGMRGGDLIAWLQSRGYRAYAASVDPIGSVWDRACELYPLPRVPRVTCGSVAGESAIF